MSLNELLLNQVKPWCNLRVNNIVEDGYPIYLNSTYGLTGGSNPQNSQGNHQYQLSGFTGGATVSLGSASPDGQVLSFVVGQMAGACTIAAPGGSTISGNLVGLSGGVIGKNYSAASDIVVGSTANLGDYFQLRTVGGAFLVHGIVKLTSAYT